jgi:DNA-binding response OmpR family regulator
VDSLKKILIIGNDQKLYNRIKNVLSLKKYDVIHTAQYNSGLKSIISKTVPELIIVDSDISRFKGVETSLLVRLWTEVPILILTATNTMTNEVRVLDLDAEDGLSEPINVAFVAERIVNILSLTPAS